MSEERMSAGKQLARGVKRAAAMGIGMTLAPATGGISLLFAVAASIADAVVDEETGDAIDVIGTATTGLGPKK